MPKQPKEKVKKHLDKRGINAATLPDPVIDALNALEDEIDQVDDLGKALMDAQNLSDPNRISAVH
jgi:hypothetical protein